jgi:hypothetical protein
MTENELEKMMVQANEDANGGMKLVGMLVVSMVVLTVMGVVLLCFW